jgi:hypothetical protein
MIEETLQIIFDSLKLGLKLGLGLVVIVILCIILKVMYNIYYKKDLDNFGQRFYRGINVLARLLQKGFNKDE